MPTKLTRRRLAFTAAPALLPAQSAKRPNLVFILSDDHSNEFLGASGNPVIKTPWLDRFAASGARFTRMFTAAPQCVPSRAAYLTGRSPVAVRMGRFTSPLPADVKTFAEHLREAGYFTGVCRRQYHLDGPMRANSPLAAAIYEKHNMVTFSRRLDYVDVSPPGQTELRVNEFLDKKPAGKPFFLWVNFNDPHHPWDADALKQPHDRAALPIPKYLPDLPGVRETLGRYYDEVGRMDSEFQLVLEILEKRRLSENTLVVFCGDNGAAIPHGKGSLYDPGCNVPCLARWPGRIRPGLVSDSLLSGEDIGPTFLEAAGLTVPKEMSGRSFLGLLEGRSYTPRQHVFAARLAHGGTPMRDDTPSSVFDLSRMARSRRHKLIYNCTPAMRYQPVDSAGQPMWKELVAQHEAGKLDAPLDQTYFGKRRVFELYDLEADPAELNNLAGKPEMAEIERSLALALQEKMIVDYDFLPLPLQK